MLGPTVLDAEKFPEIRFVSESVERLSDSHWKVHGKLTLHGQTQPVVLETRLEKGHYQGTASLLQSSSGVTPIRLAGGTIQVKNEVQIKYDIVLAGSETTPTSTLRPPGGVRVATKTIPAHSEYCFIASWNKSVGRGNGRGPHFHCRDGDRRSGSRHDDCGREGLPQQGFSTQ